MKTNPKEEQKKMVDFAEYATEPKKSSGKKAVKINNNYIKFMEALDGKARLTYNANSKLVGYLGLISIAAAEMPNGANQQLSALPAKLQYLVCKKNGQYSEKALSIWRDKVNLGYENLSVITKDKVVDAYKKWAGSSENNDGVEEPETFSDEDVELAEMLKLEEEERLLEEELLKEEND